MEGVPRIPMLNYPLRRCADAANFKHKLNGYISNHYNENVTSYTNEIGELESLRASATHIPKDLTGCSTLKKYFCQLNFLKSRFPLHEGSPIAVTFSWYDVYSETVHGWGDIDFEMSCILYNIGALHTELGTIESRQTPDGMKVACTHFQCAAWAFQHLRHNYPKFFTPDISPDMLSITTNVCLGQAQECILEKSLIDNRKSTITAKVALQIVEYYQLSLQTCEQMLKDSNQYSDKLMKAVKKWKKLIELKISYYSSVGFLYRGFQSEDQQKWGERVTFFRAAKEKLEVGFKLAKSMEKTDISSVNDTLTFTMDVIVGKLTVSERDNEFIYHDKIPDLDSISSDIKGVSLVKGIPFKFDDLSISGPDIFGRLVPIEAHEASSLYSEEKAKVLRIYSAKIEEKNEALDKLLIALQLDHLDLHSNELKIPQELIECCAALSVNKDAVKILSDKMSNLSGKFHDVESNLNEVLQLLKDEENHEKEHHELFGGKKGSNNVLLELSREVHKYQQAQTLASDSNQTLHEAMMTHVANMNILMKPLDEVLKHIPSALDIKQKDEETIGEMKKLACKVDEMRKQRQTLEAQLRDAIHSDDITKQLVVKKDEDLDTVFEEELKKHERIMQYLDQNLLAQDNIMRALTEANANYAETRIATVEVIRNRNQVIQSLLSSYEAYDELLIKCEKGIQFYKTLDDNVTKLLQRVKSVCNVQNDEREKTRKILQIHSPTPTVVPPPSNYQSTSCVVDPFVAVQSLPNPMDLPVVGSGGGKSKLKDYLSRRKAQQVKVEDPLSQNQQYAANNSNSQQYNSSQYYHPIAPPPPFDQHNGYRYASTSKQTQNHTDHQSQYSSGQYSATGGYSQNQVSGQYGLGQTQPTTGQYSAPDQYASAGATGQNQTPNQYVAAGTGQNQTVGQNTEVSTTAQYQANLAGQYTAQQQSSNFQQYNSQQQQPSRSSYTAGYGQFPLSGTNTNSPTYSNAGTYPSSMSSHSVGAAQQHAQQQQQQQYSDQTASSNNTGTTSQQQQYTGQTAHSSNTGTIPQYQQYPNQAATSSNTGTIGQQQQTSGYPHYSTTTYASYDQPYGASGPSAYYQQQQNVQVSTPTTSTQSSVQYYQPSTVPPISTASSVQPGNLPVIAGTNQQQNQYSQQYANTSQNPYSAITGYNQYYSQQQQQQQQQQQPVVTSTSTYTSPQYPTTSEISSGGIEKQKYLSTYDKPTYTNYSSEQTNYGQYSYYNPPAPTQQQQQQIPTPYANTIHSQQPSGTYNNTPQQQTTGSYVDTTQQQQPSAPYTISTQQQNYVQQQQQQQQTYLQQQTYPQQQLPQSYYTTSNPNVVMSSTQLPQQSPSNISTTPSSKNLDLLADIDLSSQGVIPLAPVICHSTSFIPQIIDSPRQQISEPNLSVSSATATDPVVPTAQEDLAVTTTSQQSTPQLPQMPISLPNGNKKGKIDPFTDPTILSKFAFEVEKLNHMIEAFHKKSLNGPTNLDLKWRELLDIQNAESVKRSISVARCYPMKNRFPDILPYDQSRVPLPSTKDDYINASFLNELSPLAIPFIATQAPLPVTFADFWHMIWYYSVELIVTLTNDVDLKGHIYWPTEKGKDLTFGPFKITLQSCNAKTNYIERIVSLSQRDLKQTRVVIHLQFTEWIGNVFPTNPAPLLSFVSEVHSFHEQQRNMKRPVVLHCIAGVGKTGVFSVLSSALKEINGGNGIVDIINCAGTACEKRKGLMIDKEYLRFIYHCLLYYCQDLLMKRGILSARTSFDKKSKVSTHTRHPSQDFLVDSLKKMSSTDGLIIIPTTTTTTTNSSSSADDPCSGGGSGSEAKELTSSGESSRRSSFTSSPVRTTTTTNTTNMISKQQQQQQSKGIYSDVPSSLTNVDPGTFRLINNKEKENNLRAEGREAFESGKGALLDRKNEDDPFDPLSSLDPLWTIKKNKG